MPKPRAVVDFSKCMPEKCDRGICVATSACELKVLKQRDPYDPPMLKSPDLCLGCGDCAEACPFNAIWIKPM